ncbi:FAD binding domain-containing protein [Acuticoccus mangrovi]|uniref:FAD binding domain-containing protein n=1 Tax=Acuticoccus mangrovi TaxID=2796142 RepID=A0A934IH69_9HYPH|nr:FAD binding domain-containing protein [Acuticoccus mangrovi]MBJ3776629.1 FAD binding domain-containing protein [Acuticoccus mangrovi]
MKLPPVAYRCPESLDEAIALLAADDEAQILSGGQSLMPMLAFRLAAPSVLVDLRRVPGLDRIAIDAEGTHVGSRVTWRALERSHALAAAQPLLAAALPHIAHYQIRNRGTVGGSLAHADPAAELPAVALTLDATIEVAGPAGPRRIGAQDFFLGAMTTALEPGEIVTALHLPPAPATRRHGFEEFARRRGDFALAGIALSLDVTLPLDVTMARDRAAPRIEGARIAAFGIADVPLRLDAVEAALEGAVADASAVAAAEAACVASVTPDGDPSADAAYRRALLATLLGRALACALENPPAERAA